MTTMLALLTVICGVQAADPARMPAEAEKAKMVEDAPTPAPGRWSAWLESPGGQLSFGINLVHDEDAWKAWLVNGRELIEVPVVTVGEGAISLENTHYDATLKGKVSEEGRRVDGSWKKRRGPDEWSTLPFHAVLGRELFLETRRGERFPRNHR